MKNILSIDLEDWNHLAYRRVTGRVPPSTGNVLRQVEALLALLEQAGAKATFFVLGLLAEQHPEVVRQVAGRGHEIACHGYAHLIVDGLTRDQFAEDTRRAQGVIEQITGRPVRGYRAAEFSIRRGSLWALEVLAELGFRYDSSIFPIHHRRYGIAGFDPQPRRYRLAGGGEIIEVPLATLPFAGLRLPVAGGGYFRLAPYWLLKKAVARLDREQLPLTTYFHPYEFDPQRLKVFAATAPASLGERLRGWKFGLHQNLGRTTLPGKVAGLLRQFTFTTCQDFLEGTDLGDSRELLSAASG